MQEIIGDWVCKTCFLILISGVGDAVGSISGSIGGWFSVSTPSSSIGSSSSIDGLEDDLVCLVPAFLCTSHYVVEFNRRSNFYESTINHDDEFFFSQEGEEFGYRRRKKKRW